MLTEEQIQHLYKFCVRHYVRYYDVQVELVDHLANSIEERMAANPTCSFERALNDVYRGFGIMGFSKVVFERTSAESKKYNTRNFQIFKSYFTVPKIVLTLLIYLSLCTPVFLSNNPEMVYLIYCLATMVFGIIFSFFFFRKYKKPKKELLMINAWRGLFGTFGLLLQLPNFYFNFLRKAFNITITPLHPVNFLIVFICVVLVVACLAGYETYKSTYNEAKKNYLLAFTDKT